MDGKGVGYPKSHGHKPLPTDVDGREETATEPVTLDEFDGAVSLDVTFGVLQNQRRRWVLRYLNDHEEPVTLSDLSEHIAALENGKSVRELSSQERKRVYVGLYQCHLPKMDDTGFVTFDKNRGLIELGPAAEYASEYLYETESTTDAWPGYYLGLVGAGWVLFGSAVASDLLVPTVALLLFLLVLSTGAILHQHAEAKQDDGERSIGAEAVAKPI